MTRSALIVEDDATSREALSLILEDRDFTVETAPNLAVARAAISRGAFDVAIVDLGLPDGDGMSLVEGLTGAAEGTAVVVLTGDTSLDRAVEAMRRGALDYLGKPLDAVRLDLTLTRVLRALRGRDERASLHRKLREVGHFHGLVGRSAPMRRLFDRIERAAPTGLPAFVLGESGTGKELIARALHALSGQRRGPFVALNCGGIPRQLAESELFGHEQGAFTGATRQHEGAFERARGGTLFLDEVTEMPLELQAVLLRVLESRTFHRVGGKQELKTDVRIIAASNRDPEAAIAAQRLRQDLFFRLHVMPLEVPPLRERGEDVLLLAEHFVTQPESIQGERAPALITDRARQALRRYRWPGNVRELKNVIQRAAVFSRDGVIEPGDLDLGVAPTLEAANGETREAGVLVPADATLAEAERLLIEAAIARHADNRTAAARALGVSVKTLYNKRRAWAESRSIH